jgi:peroxiredoxin Q/BCP
MIGAACLHCRCLLKLDHLDSAALKLSRGARVSESVPPAVNQLQERCDMRPTHLIPSIVLACALSALPSLSAAVEVGEKAPDFDLASTQSGKFKLSNLAGKKNVIVQFYVLDFTPT